MSRASDKKPRNVVKSRSAPSLLGGIPHGRKKEELPTNRFIELGDIALGNSGKREVITQLMSSKREFEIVRVPKATDIIGAEDMFGPPRIIQPHPQLGKPPRKSMPRPNLKPPAKATRPKAPKPVRPPAPAPPRPPKVYRPKPKVGTALKTHKRKPGRNR